MKRRGGLSDVHLSLGWMLSVKGDTHSVAEGTHSAARTEWRNGFADSLSEGHEETVELFPVSDRDDFPQSELRLDGRFRRNEAQPIGDSMDVGINTDSILAVTECRNEVGRFSPHPFQQEESFDGVGYFSVVFAKNHSTKISNPFGLDPVKSHGIDRCFDLLGGQL